MAQTLNAALIEASRQFLVKNDLRAFYQYFSDKGFFYPELALGVVLGNTVSGNAALGFMRQSAATQGKILTDSQISEVTFEMAEQFFLALGVKVRRDVVNADLNAGETLEFHTLGFQAFGLAPSTWTLYAPFEILGPGLAREALWQNILLSQNFFGPNQSTVNGSIFASMSLCSLACTNPTQKSLAANWMETFNVGALAQIELLFQKGVNLFRDLLSFNAIDINRVKLGADVDIKLLAGKLVDLDLMSATAPTDAQRAAMLDGWLAQLNTLRTDDVRGIRTELVQREASGVALRHAQEMNSRGDLQLEVFTTTQTNGVYNEKTYNAAHQLLLEAWNWKLQNWGGRPVDVRAEMDWNTGLYHHFVHATTDPGSMVIWEAFNWKVPNWGGHAADVRREADLLKGTYHDYVYAGSEGKAPVIWEAYNWKVANWFGSAVDVRREADLQNDTYHDVVRIDGRPGSPAIWEAYNWKVANWGGRTVDVRREADLSADTYHDYVHANASGNSPVIWEAWNWKVPNWGGRAVDVRREVDQVSKAYHDYVHASTDRYSPVIWEAWSLNDPSGRHVRHEQDNLTGLYHDRVYANTSPESAVIAEARAVFDSQGRHVRQEKNFITSATREFVHATQDANSQVIKETWVSPASKGKGVDRAEKTVAGDATHLSFTRANGDTGWADMVGGKTVAWDVRIDADIWGVTGTRPNPLYTGPNGLQPSLLKIEGMIQGELHEWYRNSGDRGWYYRTDAGIKYKVLQGGVVSRDTALTNPITGANPFALTGLVYDYKQLPGANDFEMDPFDPVPLVGMVQGSVMLA